MKALVLALAALLCANVHAAEIQVNTRALTQGEAIQVTVLGDSVAGWEVSATYLPNSTLERPETIGVTDSLGHVEWIPEVAGIVSLTAKHGDDTISRAVSVKFPSLPGGAVLVFLFAGTILLGGAGWSLVRLMEHDPKHGLH